MLDREQKAAMAPTMKSLSLVLPGWEVGWGERGRGGIHSV